MKVTWKKWTCFFIAVSILGTSCHFVSRRYLASIEAVWPAMLMKHQFSLMEACGFAEPPEPHWDQVVLGGILQYTYAPWPLSPLGPAHTVRSLDPDNPPDLDAETIMGLALLGPEPAKLIRQQVSDGDTADWDEFEQRYARWKAQRLGWFDRLSQIALARVDDEQTERRFERLVLLVQAAAARDKDSDEPPTSQPASGPSREELRESIWACSRQVDPDNATYFYDEAVRQLAGVVEELEYSGPYELALPSLRLAQEYELTEDVQMIPLTRKIDELLSHAEDRTPDNFVPYRRALLDKACSFRFPSAPGVWIKGMGHAMDVLSFLTTSPLWQMKLARRLCFLGDRLADEGEGALALRMYRHAYKIGERLMTGGGGEGRVIDALVGRLCLWLTNEHLLEYWASNRSPENVMEMNRFDRYLTRVQWNILRESEGARIDPLAHNDAVFVAYFRSAGLTLWFGAAGIGLGCVSLVSSLGYLLLRRRRYLGASASLGGRELAVLAGVPLLAFVCLGLLIPLDLEGPNKIGAVTGWAMVLIVAWIVAIGLVCRGIFCRASDTRKSLAGWICGALGLGSIIAATSAVFWAERISTAAAAIAVLGAAGCIGAWLVSVLIEWAVHRAPADRTYRAAVRKGFAVCSMFVASIALLAALASMPLTHYQQDRYYRLVETEQADEMKVYMGDDWPESFEGLSLSEQVFATGD